MTFKTGDKGLTDCGNDYEVIFVYGDRLWVRVTGDTVCKMMTYAACGTFQQGLAVSHLLPPKQKIEGVVFVCDRTDPAFFQSKQEGLEYHNALTAPLNIKAIVPFTIPYTEGEGL